jgi:pyruvate kinase
MYDRYPELETRTKIVATLGPACWDADSLAAILRAGVDVCRINCSHADHDSIRKQVARVRRATLAEGRPVAILLDLQGPKIRVGKMPEPLELADEKTLTIVMADDYSPRPGEAKVGTTYPAMADDVEVGDEVMFADGALFGKVTQVRSGTPGEVDIVLRQGGTLSSFKGINLPGTKMSVPSLTEKDLADVAVGCEVGVDYVALSFVRSSTDVLALRRVLTRLGQPTIPIIAKIEKPEAVSNIDDILDHAEGVMVARGDLGVEARIEAVPVHQKTIIEAARRKARLCITATQMLDSMERNPRPTRAESTDVANAILDGTDAVMLSGETAVGKFPVDAVRTMDRIARLVEASPFFKPTRISELPDIEGHTGLIIQSACFAVALKPRPVVVFTSTGRSALLMSKARPAAPIFALTPNAQVADQLSLAWGVSPVLIQAIKDTDDLIAHGEQMLIAQGHVKRGDEILIVAGRAGLNGSTNLMKIHRAGAED